jgi:hypothetical protein
MLSWSGFNRVPTSYNQGTEEMRTIAGRYIRIAHTPVEIRTQHLTNKNLKPTVCVPV